VPNSYGKKNGFVVESATGQLVGFLNFFESGVSLEEADKQFRAAKYGIAVSKIDMDTV
jgi:hypothetical protein